MSIRILLADDHTLVRAGIRALLGAVPDFEVVAEASEGNEAIRLARELMPDVAVVDLAMPGVTGLQVLERLQDTHPEIRTLMLSMHSSEEHVIRALRMGARGYVLKNSAPEELESGIRAVLAGETWLPSQVSKQVLESYLARIQTNDPPHLLTGRQREVLKMIADGASTRDIGAALNISVKTVEAHRAQIMEKIDVHDVAGLIRYAIRHGISEL
jgi:DNA-binding NarL/FixJ family response regulator